MSVKYAHKVKSGDTLTSISQQYGISIQSIKDANSGLNWTGERKGDRILAGEELKLPKGGDRNLADNSESEGVCSGNPLIGPTVARANFEQRLCERFYEGENDANSGGTPWYSIYNWPALGSSARTMDALYAGNYLEAGIQFATCAAEVFTFGYASEINLGVKTVVGSVKIPVYRVYGEGASMYGKSYSLINPEYVPFYRNFAGLPEVNSGQYLLKGSIPLRDINVGRWFAAPVKGNTGGLPFELYQSFDQLMYPANVLIKKPF